MKVLLVIGDPHKEGSPVQYAAGCGIMYGAAFMNRLFYSES